MDPCGHTGRALPKGQEGAVVMLWALPFVTAGPDLSLSSLWTS